LKKSLREVSAKKVSLTRSGVGEPLILISHPTHLSSVNTKVRQAAERCGCAP
jgi:hypothetical protein